MELSREVLLAWYEARDTFLGYNYRDRSYARGLMLARKLVNEVPEAAWLCSLFPEGEEDISDHLVFRRLMSCEGVPAASSYLYFLTRDRGVVGFDRDSAKKHPLYLAYTCGTWDTPTLVACADMINPEPIALARLVNTTEDDWHVRNPISLKLCRRAVDLGHVPAWVAFAHTFDKVNDPLYWLWSGKAAQRGHMQFVFVREACEYLDEFVQVCRGTSRCIVQIDAMLEHELSLECIKTSNNETLVTFYNQMMQLADMCRHWRSNARDAVSAWLVVGRRNRVVKDIRRLVGKLIWDTWFQTVRYSSDGTMCVCMMVMVMERRRKNLGSGGGEK
jgi:hypothetical protein